MADIGFITALYFLSGFFMARIFDNILDKFNKSKEKEKTTLQIIIELTFFLWINGITIYIIRNIVEDIPSPFEGIYGFKHNLLHELRYAPVLEFTLLYYQIHLTDKLKTLYNRFSTNNVKND